MVLEDTMISLRHAFMRASSRIAWIGPFDRPRVDIGPLRLLCVVSSLIVCSVFANIMLHILH
jgi:hypothetical protein